MVTATKNSHRQLGPLATKELIEKQRHRNIRDCVRPDSAYSVSVRDHDFFQITPVYF